ncbi:MAG: hypothetical protein U0230_17475 [Polyangiales bacterium]
MGKKNPTVASLEAIAKKLAKAKPNKAYPLLHEAFSLFAAAGDVRGAGTMIRLAHRAGLPEPTTPVHILGCGPMDGFCSAMGLGDLTGGAPSARHLAPGADLETRARATDHQVRIRCTGDAYGQFPAPTADPSELEGRELWRRAQALARPGDDGSPSPTEPDALRALAKYLDAWARAPDSRGAGMGQELLLGIDLALRHGAGESAVRWADALGSQMLDLLLADALALRTTSRAIGEGLLRSHVTIPEADATRITAAIEAAVAGLAGGTAPAPVEPLPCVRRVGCEYSQFHLVHAGASPATPFFEDARESAQGMSLRAGAVGIATPTDTAECEVEISIGDARTRAPKGSVQSVVFPFEVRGGLLLQSVSGGGEDEERTIPVPPGVYDVRASFVPKRASKADASAGLRAFRVALAFHPSGSLDAPRCEKLLEGEAPGTIFRPD